MRKSETNSMWEGEEEKQVKAKTKAQMQTNEQIKEKGMTTRLMGNSKQKDYVPTDLLTVITYSYMAEIDDYLPIILKLKYKVLSNEKNQGK